jgi:membrane-associated protein
VFQSIVDAISGSAWSYGIIFGVAALDVIFPLVPSEATVIAAGVLAAQGDLHLAFVILAGAAGAILGDNVMYWLGRIFGERVAHRLFSGSRRKHYERGHRLIEERGGYIILVGRFIPLGRTAVTFSAGSLGWEWSRFIRWDVLAGVVWASYAAGLGYFGGKTFEDHPFKGFLIAFGAALTVTATVEVVRWFRKRAAAHS